MKRMFLHCMAVLLMLSSAFSEAHGQWVQGNGIYGGTVTALASSGNTLFAGTYKNGIYSSTDHGETWIQTGLNNLDVQAIAISGNTIYAGIYDYGTGSMNSGFYRSFDFGVTWTQTSFNYQTVYAIGINGSTVYIGADDGVYYSTDNGTTWLPTALTNETFYSFAFSGTTIFAGGSTGIYKSSDNGSTWAKSPVINDLIYSIAITGTNVFAGTYYNGVYRSTDLGATWTQTAMNYQEVHALHIIGGNIFAGTIYEGVWVSSNNGNTWLQTSMDSKNVDALTSINSTLFAGLWGGGVYLTNDNGMNWSQTALNNDDVRAFISSGNDLFAGSASNGIYKSSDNGQTWMQHAIENIPVVAMGAHGNYLFAGGDYAGIYRSADNGDTWTQSGLGFESVYAVASQNNAVFAGTLNLFGAGKVYKSTNNGSSWTQSTPTLNNRSFISLAVSETSLFAGTFYFNMNNPFDPTRYGIYKSDDNGATWTQTSLNHKNAWSLAANGNTIFAGTFELYTAGSGVYRSLDNGQTWEQTSLNDRNVLSLVVADDKVYAGTDNGIYVSEDNGATWTPFNEGFHSTPEVYGLFATNDDLFAGTSTNSAWRRSLLPQSSEAEILSFAFNTAENPSLPADVVGVIDPGTFNITLEVLENVDVSSLVATFTLSDFANASVGGVVQKSGVTVNNFTNPVVYTVTAEAGNTQDWTVNVSIAPIPQNIIVSGALEACYNALENIEIINANVKANTSAEFKAGVGIVAEFFEVYSEGTADLKAGSVILLGEGVHIATGANFHAGIMTTIYYCNIEPALVAAKTEATTPVDNLSSESSDELFMMYPNPTSGYLSIEVKQVDETSVILIEIIGMKAERVLHQQFNGQNKFLFDLSNQAKGVYFVRVIEGNQTSTKKLIKQ